MFACDPFQVKKRTMIPDAPIHFIRICDPKCPTKAVKHVERYSPNPTK